MDHLRSLSNLALLARYETRFQSVESNPTSPRKGCFFEQATGFSRHLRSMVFMDPRHKPWSLQAWLDYRHQHSIDPDLDHCIVALAKMTASTPQETSPAKPEQPLEPPFRCGKLRTTGSSCSLDCLDPSAKLCFREQSRHRDFERLGQQFPDQGSGWGPWPVIPPSAMRTLARIYQLDANSNFLFGTVWAQRSLSPHSHSWPSQHT
jgi:hypothetical protein